MINIFLHKSCRMKSIFQNKQTLLSKIKFSLTQGKMKYKVALGSGEMRKNHLFGLFCFQIKIFILKPVPELFLILQLHTCNYHLLEYNKFSKSILLSYYGVNVCNWDYKSCFYWILSGGYKISGSILSIWTSVCYLIHYIYNKV